MKHAKKILGFSFAMIFIFGGLALAGYQYKVKKAHIGGDVVPAEAQEMLMKDPGHTFIVDVRTRPEYQMIGHPTGAYNIPLKFWTGKMGDKAYGTAANPNFGKDLRARFNPKRDKLLFICRSGKRSCTACNEAVKVGFSEKKVFNVMGGFEGDKTKYKHSAYHGQRIGGSWRNEGLPWTYHMDKKLAYLPDVK